MLKLSAKTIYKTELIEDLLVREHKTIFLNNKLKWPRGPLNHPDRVFFTIKYDYRIICTNQFDAEIPENEFSYGWLAKKQ